MRYYVHKRINNGAKELYYEGYEGEQAGTKLKLNDSKEIEQWQPKVITSINKANSKFFVSKAEAIAMRNYLNYHHLGDYWLWVISTISGDGKKVGKRNRYQAKNKGV